MFFMLSFLGFDQPVLCMYSGVYGAHLQRVYSPHESPTGKLTFLTGESSEICWTTMYQDFTTHEIQGTWRDVYCTSYNIILPVCAIIVGIYGKWLFECCSGDCAAKVHCWTHSDATGDCEICGCYCLSWNLLSCYRADKCCGILYGCPPNLFGAQVHTVKWSALQHPVPPRQQAESACA